MRAVSHRCLLPVLAGLSMLASAMSPVTGVAAEAPVVLGYYPSYRANSLPPEKINFRRFTHIVHAFAAATPQGDVKTDSNLPSKALTAAAHAAGVKVLFGIGGGSNGADFGTMAHDPAASEAFIGKVVTLVADNDYDGVDVDWEHLKEGDEQTLVDFVGRLRRELKAKRPEAMLAMAVPRSDYYGRWFNGAQLKDQVDLLQIMMYDTHGPWSHAGFNAPLNETASDPVDGATSSYARSLAYWTEKGFAKNQILVGVPCYGRGFAVTQWGQKAEKKSQYEAVTYKQVRALLQDGWIREWDAQADVPWLHKPGVDELISYDDPESARLKGAWARQAGIRGLFFWEISQDFLDGDRAIVAAAREGWEAPASAATAATTAAAH